MAPHAKVDRIAGGVDDIDRRRGCRQPLVDMKDVGRDSANFSVTDPSFERIGQIEIEAGLLYHGQVLRARVAYGDEGGRGRDAKEVTVDR